MIEKQSDKGFALKYVARLPLSLLDFDRLLELARELMEKGRNDVQTYLRVDREGIELPRNLANIRSMIKERGGFRELEYITLLQMNNFYVSGDFLKGELVIKCKKRSILQSIIEQWKTYRRLIKVSMDLLDIAISPETKRFVFSCLRKDGSLAETPEGSPRLDHVYVVTFLRKLGMKYVLDRFCDFLKEIQNSDGGWGLKPESKSEILPTASAILVLQTGGYNEEAKRGIKFLLSKVKNDSWLHELKTPILSAAISALSLYRGGIRNGRLEKLTLYVKDRIVRSKEGIENDYFSATFVKQVGIDTSTIIRHLYKKIPDQDESGGFPPENPRTTTTSVVINLLMDQGISIDDSRIQQGFNFLINSRNPDGGWPIKLNRQSELYSTILSALILKRLDYLQ